MFFYVFFFWDIGVYLRYPSTNCRESDVLCSFGGNLYFSKKKKRKKKEEKKAERKEIQKQSSYFKVACFFPFVMNRNFN